MPPIDVSERTIMRNFFTGIALLFMMPVMTVLSVCSCSSNDKESLKYESYISETAVSSDYLVQYIKFDDNQIMRSSLGYDGNYYVMGSCSDAADTVSIDVVDLIADKQDNYKLKCDELGNYENMTVRSVFCSDNVCYFSGECSFRDETGDLLDESVIGRYDFINETGLTRLIDLPSKYSSFNHIVYDDSSDKIYCISKEGTYDILYSFDSNFKITDTVSIADIIIEKYSIEDELDYFNVYDLATDSKGNIYISVSFGKLESGNEVLFKMDSSMNPEWFVNSEDLKFEKDNHLFISEDKNGNLAVGVFLFNYAMVDILDAENADILKMYEIDNKGGDFAFCGRNDASSDYLLSFNGYCEAYNFENEKAVSTYQQTIDISNFMGAWELSGGKYYDVSVPDNSEKKVLKCYSSDGEENGWFEIDSRQNMNLVYDDSGNVYSALDNEIICWNEYARTSVCMIDLSTDFLCGVADHILVCNKDDSSKYKLYSMEGEYIKSFSLPCEGIISMKSEDDKELLFYTDRSGKFFSYDVYSEKKTEIKQISGILSSSSGCYFYRCGGIYDIYMIADNHLLAYDNKSGRVVELINNIRSLGIENGYNYTVLNENGDIACTGSDGVYFLKPCSDKIDKKLLKIAVLDNSDKIALGEYARNFNMQNKTYRAEVEKYNDLNELNIQIAEGKVPDIVVYDNSDTPDRYISERMFTDLSKIIDSDPEFNSDDYLQNMISLYSGEVGTYKIFSSFSIRALLVTEKLQGLSWNFTEFLNEMNKYNERGILSYKENEDVLLKFIPYYIKAESEGNKKEISFDTEVFNNLITYVKMQKCGERMDFDDDTVPKFTWFKNGKCVLSQVEISDFGALENEYTFNEGTELFIKGYPGRKEGYISAVPNMCFSISEKCSDKKAAWDFIKYFLSDDYQIKSDTNIYTGFPVKKTAYNLEVEKARKQDFKMAKKIEEAILMIDTPIEINSTINAIIKEEIMKFYADTVTADEVLKNIQTKVNLYKNE